MLTHAASLFALFALFAPRWPNAIPRWMPSWHCSNELRYFGSWFGRMRVTNSSGPSSVAALGGLRRENNMHVTSQSHIVD
jgi:hypothetical protein